MFPDLDGYIYNTLKLAVYGIILFHTRKTNKEKSFKKGWVIL